MTFAIRNLYSHEFNQGGYMKSKFLILVLLGGLAACGDKAAPVTGASAPVPAATTASVPTPAVSSSVPSSTSKPEGPPYDQARALYNDLSKFQADIGLWHQKPASERMKLTQQLNGLSKWVDQNWPQSERCKGAINMAAMMASDMNIMTSRATSGNSVDMHSIQSTIFNSVVFGQNMAGCYDEAEALDVKQ